MTVFVAFGFPATGAPASRTMPDRLSDIINVKDWGALGDHNNNDAPAIQAAIEYCISKGGGTVFFPPGYYLLTAPTTVACSSDDATIGVRLVGSGMHNTFIYGTIAGTGGATGNNDNIESLENLAHYGGRFTPTRANILMWNIDFAGGADTTAGNGALIYNCQSSGVGGPANQDPPGPTPGTVAFYLGSGTSMVGCRVQGGFDITYAISGEGVSLIGNATEVCNTACRVGWGPGGETLATGCVVASLQTERCNTAMDLYYCKNCLIQNSALTGTDGTPSTHGPISNITWDAGGGGIATVTTTGAHNIPAGTHILQFSGTINPGGLCPAATRFGTGNGSGQFVATVTGATTFTYPLPDDPGAYVTAEWNWPLQYGIRCRKVSQTAIIANKNDPIVSEASLDLDYDGEADLHSNNVFLGSELNFGVIIPAGKNRAGWQFSSVSGVASLFGAGTAADPYNTMVFADLPGQAGVQQTGPLEGQEYTITDSNLAAAGNWNATVTGGGANNVKVRYDGANWKIAG